jgi:hypothetical protein
VCGGSWNCNNDIGGSNSGECTPAEVERYSSFFDGYSITGSIEIGGFQIPVWERGRKTQACGESKNTCINGFNFVKDSSFTQGVRDDQGNLVIHYNWDCEKCNITKQCYTSSQ